MCGLRFAACAAGRLRCIETKSSVWIDLKHFVLFSVKVLNVFVLLQQNHEVLMSLYKDMEEGTYVPNSVSNTWSNRKKEEKELIDSLLTHFSKQPQSYSRTKVWNNPGKVLHILMLLRRNQKIRYSMLSKQGFNNSETKTKNGIQMPQK